jgi:hypothetical protein
MSMLRVVCANPRCQKVLRIRPSQAGTRIRCPSCQVALIAPQVPGSASEGSFDGLDAEDAGAPVRRPFWMTALFCLGILGFFFGLVVASIGFEVWRFIDTRAVNQGPLPELLAAGAWKIAGPKGKQAAKAPVGPVWSSKDSVWTFHADGKAETGKLMESKNRYDRAADRGFRSWKWSVDDNEKELTMTFKEKNTEETVKYKIVPLGEDKLELRPVKLAGSEEPASGEDAEKALERMLAAATPLTLDKIDPVDNSPDRRIVFYGGVLFPMLVTVLLSSLISREVFHNGCLRFALAWPLTVLLGLALGAGAGFLMDMLDDFSFGHGYGTLPYWMLLSFVQGALCLFMGLWLAALSCLRPT